jgi:hypothetical protein
MAAVDLRSLCLIVAMRRSGRGSGRHLVPHSRRFTLSATQGCLAALAPREGGGRRWGGGWAQVGKGGAGGGERGVTKTLYFDLNPHTLLLILYRYW